MKVFQTGLLSIALCLGQSGLGLASGSEQSTNAALTKAQLEKSWERLQSDSLVSSMYDAIIQSTPVLEEQTESEACDSDIIDIWGDGGDCDDSSGGSEQSGKFYRAYHFPIDSQYRAKVMKRQMILERFGNLIEVYKQQLDKEEQTQTENITDLFDLFGDLDADKQRTIDDEIWTVQRSYIAQQELRLIYLSRYQDTRSPLDKCSFLRKAKAEHESVLQQNPTFKEGADRSFSASLGAIDITAFETDLSDLKICSLAPIDRVQNQDAQIEISANDLIRTRVNQFLQSEGAKVGIQQARLQGLLSEVSFDLRTGELFTVEKSFSELYANLQFLRRDGLDLKSKISDFLALDLQKIFRGNGPSELPSILIDQEAKNQEAIQDLQKYVANIESLYQKFSQALGDNANPRLQNACSNLQQDVLGSFAAGDLPEVTETTDGNDLDIFSEGLFADISILPEAGQSAVSSRDTSSSLAVYDSCIQAIHQELDALKPDQETTSVLRDFSINLKKLSETLTTKILK